MSTHKQWIKTLADLQGGRPFFSDQTEGSLGLIGRLVEIYHPTKIIELGTNYGLSLRRWREVAPAIPVTCIDASFAPLKQSQTVLELNLHGVSLIEKMVHDVDLAALWGSDRVLLYADIHSDHDHVFDAIPKLPDSSIVIFDDVWRSPMHLYTPEDKELFFNATVMPQIDRTAPREIMPNCYSHYWRGGGFWGFGEIEKICAWSKEKNLTLHWEEGIKIVFFQWPQDTRGVRW